jgi:hypothetical protein
MPAWTDWELSGRGEEVPGDEAAWDPRVAWPTAKKTANIRTAHAMKASVRR